MDTKTKKSGPPSNNKEFDKAYSSIAHWAWSDIRIPRELKQFIKENEPENSLELGCGLGKFSIFMAENGVKATGVDFSSVAIEKAKNNAEGKKGKVDFMVGDVTNLAHITDQFDVAFDVGCFHCLNEKGQAKYVEEVYRLLKPGGKLLLWALDNSPGDIKLNSDQISKIFGSRFELTQSKFSGRRVIFVSSHWYWLNAKK